MGQTSELDLKGCSHWADNSRKRILGRKNRMKKGTEATKK